MNWNDLHKFLTIPGDGVYTVHTAKERKEKLQALLYKNSPEEMWKKNFNNPHSACILGIPSDTGGGILRGANWGPLFIRESLYSQVSSNGLLDLGDIRTIPHLLTDEMLSSKTLQDCRQALYQSQDENPVSPLTIAEHFLDFYHQLTKAPLLGLGGDHSVSYPLVKSYLKAKKGKRVGILHFDAHTDLLAHRLGVPICFGSWAYHILNDLHSPKDLIQIGIRSSGYDKKYWENHLGVQQYWAYELEKQGPQVIGQKILRYLQEEKIEEVYISFDIDAIDSSVACATGTPETQGPLPHVLKVLLDEVIPYVKLTGADLVEVAPFVRHPDIKDESGLTVEIAANFCQYFLENFDGSNLSTN